MRTYRSPGGERRLWFSETEIEDIMDDELRRAGLLPTPDRTVVDLEALIEEHLASSLDQYAVLPGDVLGLTEFQPGQSPAVRINGDLTGALDAEWCPPGVEGRWRATLAHEAAHVILHRSLFEVDVNQTSLFGDEPAEDAPRLLRCLKRDLSHAAQVSDWREVQANRGMAALLMPRSPFAAAARDLEPASKSPDHLTRLLAARFGVSRQATTIRLRTLGFIREDQAESLFSTAD